jgi:hypothetical protein
VARDCEGGCVGGWKEVQEAYALQEAAKAGDPGDPRYEAALAAARNTVYPCRICNKAAFFRWAGGHLDPEHDRSTCGECLEAGAPSGHRKQHRKGGGNAEPPPPGDDDYRGHTPDYAERAAGDTDR